MALLRGLCLGPIFGCLPATGLSVLPHFWHFELRLKLKMHGRGRRSEEMTEKMEKGSWWWEKRSGRNIYAPNFMRLSSWFFKVQSKLILPLPSLLSLPPSYPSLFPPFSFPVVLDRAPQWTRVRDISADFFSRNLSCDLVHFGDKSADLHFPLSPFSPFSIFVNTEGRGRLAP